MMSRVVGGAGAAQRLAIFWAAVIVSTPALGQSEPQPESYSLTRALQLALDNNEVLQQAEFDLQIAGQQVREAWSSVLPDVRVNASYQRNLRVQQGFLPAQLLGVPGAGPDDLIAVRFGADNTWNAGLNASQPLFEYTAFIGLGVAGKFRSWQTERVRGVAQDVVTTVRIAYFDALLAEETVRLTDESVNRVRQTLAETRAMNRAGLASEYDVLRLEVQLGNLVPSARRAANALSAARRTLLIEMGLDPEIPIALEGRLNSIDLADPERNDPANAALLTVSGAETLADLTIADAQRVALERRSDVRLLRSEVLLNEARANVERSEYFPKLSLFSNYNITAQQNGSPSFFGTSNERTSTAVAGLQVEVPIFTGFSRSARLGQANAAVRQSESRLERLERETVSQIRTLLDNVQEARERAASQRLAVAQAQRGFEIASAEYRAGIGSQLQITDAEVALRESEFNYAQAVYDYLTARARLEAAVGTTPDEAGSLAATSGQ